MANRPDIKIHDKEEHLHLIMDIAILDDLNIIQKEAEKVNKYRDLQIKVQRMWSAKTYITPVMIGALRTMSKSLTRNLEEIPGRPSAHQCQKVALTQNCRNPKENTSLNHFGNW